MASIMDGERQFHIRTIPEEVGRYVIMPGDPGRVPKIAALLDDAKQVAQNREYNVYTITTDVSKPAPTIRAAYKVESATGKTSISV